MNAAMISRNLRCFLDVLIEIASEGKTRSWILKEAMALDTKVQKNDMEKWVLKFFSRNSFI